MHFGKILKAKGKGKDEQIEELALTSEEASFLEELAEDYNIGLVNKTVRNLIDYYMLANEEFLTIVDNQVEKLPGKKRVIMSRVTKKHQDWLIQTADRWTNGDRSEVIAQIIRFLQTEEDVNYIFQGQCSARESIELYNDLITNIIPSS